MDIAELKPVSKIIEFLEKEEFSNQVDLQPSDFNKNPIENLNKFFNNKITALKFEYSDYGGSIFDVANIQFLKTHYTNNIMCYLTHYSGEICYLIGLAAQIEEIKNYLENYPILDDDTLSGLEEELRQDLIKEIKTDTQFKAIDDTIIYRWLIYNSHTLATSLDYSYSKLIKDLIETD